MLTTRLWLPEALAKRDLDAAMEYINENTVDDFVAIGLIEGRTAIRRFFDELLAAFPDFEISMERIVGSANAITAAICTATGGSPARVCSDPVIVGLQRSMEAQR